MMNEKFPSLEKLKSKILIDRLFSEGKSIKIFPLKLIYLPLQETGLITCKTSVSVPKRTFKKAVDRNYFKRLIREAFRKNKYLVEGNQEQKYAMMFVYTTPKKIDFDQINTSLIQILEKLKEKEASYEKINN